MVISILKIKYRNYNKILESQMKACGSYGEYLLFLVMLALAHSGGFKL